MRPCLFCGGSSFHILFSGPRFDDAQERFELIGCANCHLVRTAPALSPDELQRYYDTSYYGSYEAKFPRVLELLLRVLHWSRARLLLSKVRAEQAAPVRILDVGCGRGVFLKVLRRWGCECHGTELPGFSFPTADEGIHFRHGVLEELQFEDEYFDAVSIWHVLEHTSNPASTLKEVARILKPSGVVAIAVPNFGSYQRRLFNEHWFHLDLPRHTHHFSISVLSEMLRVNDLEAVQVGTNSIDQNLFGFVQSCLNMTFSGSMPNHLYSMLKARRSGRLRIADAARFLGFFLLASVASPFALLENTCSVIAGQGATAIVYARKMSSGHESSSG